MWKEVGVTWKSPGISTESLYASDKEKPQANAQGFETAFPTVLNLRVECLQGGRRQLPLLNQLLYERFEGLELRLCCSGRFYAVLGARLQEEYEPSEKRAIVVYQILRLLADAPFTLSRVKELFDSPGLLLSHTHHFITALVGNEAKEMPEIVLLLSQCSPPCKRATVS